MKVIQILLFPVSLLYGFFIRLRNFLFDRGVLSCTGFKTPVISIGNLSLGGTGKSPHLEYLIELLEKENKVATLSRGYGRKTNGFILVDKNSNYRNVGDEPLQFKKSFDHITIAVDENRVSGVQKLLQANKNIDVILLDDAYQHRKIKPGLSILLTDYRKPYYRDFVLPSGTLREPRSGAKRADIIIITKAPPLLLEGDRENIINHIKPLPHQQVYFSDIIYGDFVPISKKSIGDQEVIKEFFFDAGYSILLFTGIANSAPLVRYLKPKVKELIHHEFPDHHSFSKRDIEIIHKKFHAIPNKNKILLTTRKDAVRLEDSEIKKIIDEMAVYYVPIKINFEEKDRTNFNKQIQQYVEQNRRSS